MNSNPDILNIWNCCKIHWILYAVFLMWICICYYCVKKHRDDFAVLANHIIPALLSSTAFVVFITLFLYLERNLDSLTIQKSHMMGQQYITGIIWISGIVGMAAYICLAFLTGWMSSSGGRIFLILPLKFFFNYTPADLKHLPIKKEDSSMWGRGKYFTVLIIEIVVLGIILSGLHIWSYLHLYQMVFEDISVLGK